MEKVFKKTLPQINDYETDLENWKLRNSTEKSKKASSDCASYSVSDAKEGLISPNDKSPLSNSWSQNSPQKGLLEDSNLIKQSKDENLKMAFRDQAENHLP